MWGEGATRPGMQEGGNDLVLSVPTLAAQGFSAMTRLFLACYAQTTR